MTLITDKRIERSIAGRMYPSAKSGEPKRPPIDGWAKQRKEWGENVDHRTRGAVSPLGGQVKRSKP